MICEVTMSANMIIQYSLVGIVLLGACVWILIKIFKKNKNKGPCCGCSLSDTCNKNKS